MFYDRLKEACKTANTTVTAALKAIGIGTANGTYWKNGSVPSSDIVIKLAEFLNVSTDYLLMGQSPSFSLSDSEKELINLFKSLSDEDKGRVLGKAETLAEIAAQNAAEEAAKKKAIALKHRTMELFDLPASAGTGVYLSSNYSAPISVLSTPESEQADYAVRISGDSMQPDFCDGDIALVESCEEVEVGEIGIFILDGESFIKELGDGCLISHNAKYSDIQFREYDTVTCRGRVLGKAQLT